MRPIYWKLALTVLAGSALGLFGGQATIAGMAPPMPAIADRAYPAFGAGNPSEATSLSPDYARIADRCDDCSDYDLGYRFAAARHVRQSAECMDFTWSYQRGCLAYLREG